MQKMYIKHYNNYSTKFTYAETKKLFISFLRSIFTNDSKIDLIGISLSCCLICILIRPSL